MWISQNPYKSVHFAEPSPEKDCNPLEFASSKFHKVQCITMNEYVCQSFLIYQGTRSMGPVGGEPCEETSSVNPTILALTELSSLVGCRMLYIKVATKVVTLGNLTKIPLFIHLDLP